MAGPFPLLNPGRKPAVRFGSPKFEVCWESKWDRLRTNIAALKPSGIPRRRISATEKTFELTGSALHSPVRSLSSSLTLHGLAVVLLAGLPFASDSARRASATEDQRQERIVYDLRQIRLALAPPTLLAPGPGGSPGQGEHPDRLPAKGSTTVHLRWTIVSNPKRPDNKRQTIIQPMSPPDLIIKEDVSLPIIIPEGGAAPAKPRIEPNIRVAAPEQRRTESQQPAPDVAAQASDLSWRMQTSLSNDKPKMPVPLQGPIAAPRARAGPNAQDSGSASEGAPDGAAGSLLAIGLDPAAGTSPLISVPPGNRYGSFSISPSGGQPGSPGGVPGGDPQGGSGGPGNGGDSSAGAGSGTTGGGGGGSNSGSVVTIRGGANGSGGVIANLGGGGGRGALNAAIPASMVYPVEKQAASIRKNMITVMSGPIGGGGLSIYNVLHCGKVYTVFLPMPGKSWVLQFCALGAAAPARNSGAPQQAVSLGRPLVAPNASEQFDFVRLPVPPEQTGKMIILHGVLREDGTVEDLKIHRGVQAAMDQAALIAFGRWKFKPALQNGQPVGVEVLVGVPAQLPEP